MGKFAPDSTMDVMLQKISEADEMTIVSGSPLTYAESHTGSSILARFSATSGCFVIGDATPNGRKVTISARTSGSITLTGQAQGVCLNHTGSAVLLYCTTALEQTLTQGGTVDTSSFSVSIADPV